MAADLSLPSEATLLTASKSSSGESSDKPFLPEFPREEELTSAELSETSEAPSLRAQLQAAVSALQPETRNALLLQAVQHYTQVKQFRDELIVRLGQLDGVFAEVVVREAEEESRSEE